MNLQENYRRLFKGKPGTNDKSLLKEAIKIDGKEVDVKNSTIGGVDKSAGPDDGTVDAFFEDAVFVDGKALNDRQLEKLNDEHYEAAVEYAIDNFHNF